MPNHSEYPISRLKGDRIQNNEAIITDMKNGLITSIGLREMLENEGLTKLSKSDQNEINIKNALRRIELCKQHRRKKLNLSHLHLAELPEELLTLHWLEKIDLSSNKLKRLPDWIGDLKNLTVLDLEANLLISLPDTIGNLKSLKKINVSFNQLKTLPETFGNLASLESFNLMEETNHPKLEKMWGRQTAWFAEFPESFCNLRSLKYFIIDNTKIINLPGNFDNLSSLKSLCIWSDTTNYADSFFPGTMKNLKSLRYIDITCFDRVPGFISEMKKLTVLDLSHNKFYTLPDFIGNLTNLRELNLHSTWITELPEWIANLKNLADLDISNNNITKKPAVIKKLPKLKTYNDGSNPFNMNLNRRTKIKQTRSD